MNHLKNSDSNTSAHIAQILLLPLNFQIWISFSNQKSPLKLFAFWNFYIPYRLLLVCKGVMLGSKEVFRLLE